MLTHNLLTHTTYSPHNLLTTQLAHHTTCSPHSLLTHNLLTHNLLTHIMFTHNLLTHTTCSRTTCSHTTCSHTIADTQLTHTHNLLTHNLLTHTQLTHTQLTHRDHTQHVHTQLLTHNLLTHTHNLLTHSLLTTQLAHHTTCSHTTCSHTTYSPHNLLTTQLAHTQLAHTQLTHTQLAHSHTTYSHTTCPHTTYSQSGRRGTYGTGLALVARLGLSWRRGCRGRLRGRRGTWRHGPLLCLAGVALGDMDVHFAWQAWRRWAFSGGALGSELTPWAPRPFAWQVWRLATWTVTLPGRRGTWRHAPSLCVAGVALTALGWLWWRAWVWVDAVGAAAVCVAGVALGDMDRYFAWQAWHLATWTWTLRGRRGTWGHASSLFAASVALGGDMDRYFAWQVWHLWHWAGSGGALGSELTPWAPRPFAWQVWHLATWTVTLPGRRGTWRHGPSLCVAGVALTALGWLWWRAWVGSGGVLGSELTPAPRPFHCCTRRSFTISFLFPAFPIPSFYLSFAAYWKKLTCGVIRSFNCCFCCSSLRAIDTGGKRLITTYDYISPRFPVPFLSLVADCIWLFRLVDLRHISLDKISGI